MSMDIVTIDNIPKIFNVDKELSDVNYIGVNKNGDIFNLVSDEPIKIHEHEKYRSIFVKGRKYFIHRLVAIIFVHNPDYSSNKVVFHINKNTLDNRSVNLVWTTQSFASRTRKNFDSPNRGKRKRATKGDFVKEYDNGSVASRELDLNRSEIYRVCKELRNHCGGYKFEYID